MNLFSLRTETLIVMRGQLGRGSRRCVIGIVAGRVCSDRSLVRFAKAWWSAGRSAAKVGDGQVAAEVGDIGREGAKPCVSPIRTRSEVFVASICGRFKQGKPSTC